MPKLIGEGVATELLTQQYDITGLAGLWLPAAYSPARIDGIRDASFHDESASLYLREATNAEGTQYRLDSLLPRFGSLDAATPPPPGAVAEGLVSTPDLDPAVLEQLAAVTAAAPSPFRQMLALQTWFREEFEYDDRSTCPANRMRSSASSSSGGVSASSSRRRSR